MPLTEFLDACRIMANTTARRSAGILVQWMDGEAQRHGFHDWPEALSSIAGQELDPGDGRWIPGSKDARETYEERLAKALQALEDACEARAAAKTQEQYELEVRLRQKEILGALDASRSEARALLRERRQ